MLRPAGEWLEAFGEPLHRIARGPDAGRQNYYRPLAVVWLSALAAGSDTSPRVLRLGGLAVGSLCLGLFGMLAWRLLGDARAALFAALFVAVHPVGIESFVWISGISGPLCALFSMAALALAALAWRSPRSGALVSLGILSLLALLLALLSKERAMVEPLLLVAVLLSAARIPGLPPASASGARGAGLVAAHAAGVALYALLWRPAVLGVAGTGLAPIGGSAGTQLLSAIASWPSSLGWLFVPWVSSTNDSVRIVTSPGDPGFLLGAALALGSLLAWGLLLRAGRPVAALGLAWLWIAFLPTAGLLPMLHGRGERYLYLSAFGVALLLADLGRAALAGPGRRRVAATALACGVLAGLALRNATRLPDWVSSETLFGVEVERDPEYREGRFLLAAEQFGRGRHREADVHLRVLLRPARAPTRAGYLNWLPVFELSCANELALGRPVDALALESRAGPALATSPAFRTCLGEAQEQLGQPAAALAHYRAAATALGPAAPPALRRRIARLRAGRAP